MDSHDKADDFVDICRMLAHHILYESKRRQAGFSDTDAVPEDLQRHVAERDRLYAHVGGE